MIITTTQELEGYDIDEYIGVVHSKEEDTLYIDNLIKDLVDQAEELGADAIVGLTFISASKYEEYYDEYRPCMVAYGTAVRIS